MALKQPIALNSLTMDEANIVEDKVKPITYTRWITT